MKALLLRFFPFLSIGILSFSAWQPLLTPGFFSMHDDQQVARLFEFSKSLASGQFPVRWVEGLGFGYGYPLFNFYPPLVYYLGELFHLAGVGYIDSIKLVWFVAIVGSGWAMYLLTKEFFGRAGGIVSAIFYVFAPYHAVDAYVRGALAELFSFVWLPLILLFAYKLVSIEYKKYSVLTGLFLALLMITHNLIFLPFFAIFVIWLFTIFLIYRGQNKNKFIIYNLSFIILVAFGLSAFFWLPSLVEKQFTLVDQLLIKNLASYTIHFVCPQQLWDSPWGFGGSVPGCFDGVSFKIGKLHLLAAFGSLILAQYLWLREKRKMASVIVLAGLLLTFSIFMTTPLSKFIWDHISLLWYLQFPWRFLEFIVLFSSFLAGSLVMISNSKHLRYLISLVLILLVVFLGSKYFQPQNYLMVSDSDLTSDSQIKWHVSSTSFEFMNGGVATKITDQGVVWVDVDETTVARDKYHVTNGEVDVIQSQFSPDEFLLSGHSKGRATVEFQIENFPGWEVWVNDQPARISDDNKYKLITVAVPEGNFKIEGRFTNTPMRRLGNLITLGTMVIIPAVYVARRVKK